MRKQQSCDLILVPLHIYIHIHTHSHTHTHTHTLSLSLSLYLSTLPAAANCPGHPATDPAIAIAIQHRLAPFDTVSWG